jgi:hypothetical protein
MIASAGITMGLFAKAESTRVQHWWSRTGDRHSSVLIVESSLEEKYCLLGTTSRLDLARNAVPLPQSKPRIVCIHLVVHLVGSVAVSQRSEQPPTRTATVLPQAGLYRDGHRGVPSVASA